MLEKINSIPEKPGVYIWKDINEDILYIGKSKNLKKRMLSYFKSKNIRTLSLVSKIKNFDYIITNNEQESLVLEKNLIEKNLPPYNILLKDNKRYPYIKLSFFEKPKISLVYRIQQKNNKTKYYGPFPSGSGIRTLVNYLEQKLLYEDGLPAKNKSKYWYESRYEYVKKILDYKKKNIFFEIKKDMNKFAEMQQYELALELRDVLKIFTQLSEKQIVQIDTYEDIDFIGFVLYKSNIFITILHYRYGNLISKEDFVIPLLINKKTSASSFISQYYWKNLKVSQIFVNWNIDNEIETKIPIKGIKKKILDIAIENSNDNIHLKFEKFKHRENISLKATESLKQILNMNKLTHIIMVDNSNTMNNDPVSAFVSFRNGIKNPNEYRKYKVEAIDNRKSDVEYIRQGINKYFKNNNMPDLLIVDGGKAQINEASKILPNLKIIGLVKDQNHKTKHIVDSNGKVIEINDQNLFSFLSGMQFEVDKYAKFYHRNLRNLSSLQGELTKINGVGLKTEIKLLKHFKNYSNIYNASLVELEKVVNSNIAKNIIEYKKITNQ